MLETGCGDIHCSRNDHKQGTFHPTAGHQNFCSAATADRSRKPRDASNSHIYWSGRFLSKEKPNNPVDCASGSAGRAAATGGGALWATGGGALAATGGSGGPGKLSHFSEYTSLPSAIRPIGAQGSARALTPLGGNLVCPHAGEENRRIAIASFFIGFFSKNAPHDTIEPDRPGKSIGVIGVARFACRIFSRKNF